VEVLSRYVNWKDRGTCILFGDGAGAAVLVRDENTDRGILSTHIRSDGNAWDLITIPGGGTLYPQSEQTLAEGLNYIHMQGRETFKLAVKNIAGVSAEALEANGLKVEDVDHLVSHQANSRIIQAVVDRLKFPEEKVHINLDRYGNTSAASIPITLDEALSAGKIKDNELILMTAFGAGLTWGSAVVRW
jgi:3-oxoacyl-[acyl-carrier-protein] synthase-3